MSDPLEPLRDHQGGRCAMCQEIKVLVVDHDHETGLVRGLLCHRCNVSEGRSNYPWIRAYRAAPPAALLGLIVEYGKHLPAVPGRGKSRTMVERWLVHVHENGLPPCPDGEDPELWQQLEGWASLFGELLSWDDKARLADLEPIVNALSARAA